MAEPLTPSPKSNFPFVALPTLLFHSAYKDIMPEAKVVYAFMHNRMSLSQKNKDKFTNEHGEIYIIFPLHEIMDVAGCRKDKASKILQQLVDHHLIRCKRVGCGRPYEIVVLPHDWSRIDPEEAAPPPTCSQKKVPEAPEPSSNWAESFVRSYYRFTQLEDIYPSEVLDRVASALASVRSSAPQMLHICEKPVNTDDLEHVLTHMEAEQLSCAIRQIMTQDLRETSSILQVLWQEAHEYTCI